MKRTKTLTLFLMGSMAAGTSGCGTNRADEGMYTFTSLDECVTSALFSEAECRELALGAVAQAPRFNSLEDCEAQFGVGGCGTAGGAAPDVPSATGDPSTPNGPGAPGGQDGTEVRPHSGGMWMPMMMGFMAGRFMSGGGMMQGSQGLFRDPAAGTDGRSFRTAGGETVKTGPGGKVSNLSPRMTQNMSHTAKPASARSGFGSRGGFSGGSGYGGGAS